MRSRGFAPSHPTDFRLQFGIYRPIGLQIAVIGLGPQRHLAHPRRRIGYEVESFPQFVVDRGDALDRCDAGLRARSLAVHSTVRSSLVANRRRLAAKLDLLALAN